MFHELLRSVPPPDGNNGILPVESTCPAVSAGLKFLEMRASGTLSHISQEELRAMLQKIRTITDELAAEERADFLRDLDKEIARGKR